MFGREFAVQIAFLEGRGPRDRHVDRPAMFAGHLHRAVVRRPSVALQFAPDDVQAQQAGVEDRGGQLVAARGAHRRLKTEEHRIVLHADFEGRQRRAPGRQGARRGLAALGAERREEAFFDQLFQPRHHHVDRCHLPSARPARAARAEDVRGPRRGELEPPRRTLPLREHPGDHPALGGAGDLRCPALALAAPGRPHQRSGRRPQPDPRRRGTPFDGGVRGQVGRAAGIGHDADARRVGRGRERRGDRARQPVRRARPPDLRRAARPVAASDGVPAQAVAGDAPDALLVRRPRRRSRTPAAASSSSACGGGG